MRRSWQADHKRGALSRDVVVAGNLAPMLFDDAITDAEAESSPLANFLGREKWIEDLVGMGDALPVIGEGNFDEVAALRGYDLNPGGISDFVNGVVSVVQDVEENLL